MEDFEPEFKELRQLYHPVMAAAFAHHLFRVIFT
jgi:hypothetical protein